MTMGRRRLIKSKGQIMPPDCSARGGGRAGGRKGGGGAGVYVPRRRALGGGVCPGGLDLVHSYLGAKEGKGVGIARGRGRTNEKGVDVCALAHCYDMPQFLPRAWSVSA
jgi:hypothetical protein